MAVAVDVSRHNEVPILIDRLGYVHRQSLSDEISLRVLRDGRLSPAVLHLIIDESVFGKSAQYCPKT